MLFDSSATLHATKLTNFFAQHDFINTVLAITVGAHLPHQRVKRIHFGEVAEAVTEH